MNVDVAVSFNIFQDSFKIGAGQPNSSVRGAADRCFSPCTVNQFIAGELAKRTLVQPVRISEECSSRMVVVSEHKL